GCLVGQLGCPGGAAHVDGHRLDGPAVPLHRTQGDILMAQAVIWSELTAAELRDKARDNAIVLLPVASMEQHGPHLPVGVDSILCEGICRRAAEAVAGGMGGLVAPTPWGGMGGHPQAIGGAVSLR